MRYEVRLSDAERAELGGLIGRSLDWVGGDGWSVQINAGGLRLTVVPKEEHTPDAEHPYAETTRLMFSRRGDSELASSAMEVGSDLGVICAVRILSTYVSFSPVTEKPARELVPGVAIGPSSGYEEVHHASLASAQRSGPDPAVVGLDLGVEFATNSGITICLFALGYSVRVSVDETSAKEGLDENVYAVSVPPPA